MAWRGISVAANASKFAELLFRRPPRSIFCSMARGCSVTASRWNASMPAARAKRATLPTVMGGAECRTSIARVSGSTTNSSATFQGFAPGTTDGQVEINDGMCVSDGGGPITVQVPNYFFSPSAKQTTTPTDCTLEGAIGYFVDVSYYVADANSNRISQMGMAPGEDVSDGTGWHDAFATPTTTRADGSFDDTPRGACYPTSGHFCAPGNPQSFRLTSNGIIHPIATNTTSKECTDGIQLVIQGNPTAQNKTYTFGNTQ